MRVLFLVTGIRSPAASGSKFIQNQIFELSNKGINATIISPIYIHTESKMISWAKMMENKYHVRFILIDTPTFIKKYFLLHIILSPILTTFIVIKTLLKEEFDIVHEFTSTPIILIRCLLYRLFNIPSVITLSVYNRTILGNFFWFKIFDFGTAYLIPSKEIIKKLISIGIKRNKIFFILPGINTAKFQLELSQQIAKQKLKLPNNPMIITYYGPLNQEKGVFDLIKASQLIPSMLQEKVLIILFSYYLKNYGNHAKLAKEIRRDAPKNVRLYEKFVDIPLLLAASDIIIFPQRTGHGTTIPPISLIEALAAHKPVLVTKITGIKELITKNNGILIQAENPQSLAQVLSTSILQRGSMFDLNKLRTTNKKILKGFDLVNVTNQILSIYYKISRKNNL